jgi:hypothetical protein
MSHPTRPRRGRHRHRRWGSRRHATWTVRAPSPPWWASPHRLARLCLALAHAVAAGCRGASGTVRRAAAALAGRRRPRGRAHEFRWACSPALAGSLAGTSLPPRLPPVPESAPPRHASDSICRTSAPWIPTADRMLRGPLISLSFFDPAAQHTLVRHLSSKLSAGLLQAGLP